MYGNRQSERDPSRSGVVYTIEVHFFSDANTVKTGTDDALVYLVDDRGRRFPLVDDPSVVPINTRLGPGQSLNTSLTVVTPIDVAHLFLTGDAPLPDRIPVAWRFFKIYADLRFGYEKLAQTNGFACVLVANRPPIDRVKRS